MQEERQAQGIESHIANENRQIVKILAGNSAALKLLDEVALRMIPERGTLADMPDRVALARQIAGLSKASVQAELKKRVAKPGQRGVGVRVGNGVAPSNGGGRRAAADEEEVPKAGTDEFRRWAAGLD